MRRSDQRRAAVVALYQQEVTGRPLGELIPRESTPFTRELAEGTDAARAELDALIERYSEGWTLDRIAPLERSILRVALFELLHRSDVPAEVAIDEAVEAAKELCGADAPGFVNGILGTVERKREQSAANSLRSPEEGRSELTGPAVSPAGRSLGPGPGTTHD